MKKFLKSLLLLFLVLLCGGQTAQGEETRQVKVGFFPTSNFQEKDEEGDYVGYGNEYLREICGYANWDCVYIDGTYASAMEQLKNGDIDLMLGIQKSKALEADYLFSESPIGSGTLGLYVQNNREEYIYGDWASFGGMIVAAVENSVAVDHLHACEQKHGVVFQVQTYETVAKACEAVEKGEAQAVCTSVNQNLENLRCIGAVSTDEYYFITGKENQELMEELDTAMSQIIIYEPYFELEMANKYYAPSVDSMPDYTLAEQHYIEGSAPLKVVYYDGMEPLMYKEASEEIFRGIVADVFQTLETKTGLTFTYICADSYLDAVEMIEEGEADLLCCANHSQEWAVEHNMVLTDSYMSIPGVRVTRRTNDTDGKFAVRTGSALGKQLNQEEICYYDTYEECMDAVLKGEVSSAFANAYIAKNYLAKAGYERLDYTVMSGVEENISIGVSKNMDKIAYRVIDRAVNYISSSETLEIVENNISQQENITLAYFFYENPLLCMGVAGGIAGVIIILLLLITINSQKYALKINHLLYEDEITGGWSYEKFVKETKGIFEGRDKGSFALIDINILHFKIINDTYGYTAGNQVLKFIWEFMREECRADEYYTRLHADHFISIIRYEDMESLKERVRKLIPSYLEFKKKKNINMKVELCVGIYPLEETDTDLSTVIDLAAFAREKCEKEKVNICFYQEEFHKEIKYESALEGEMEHALESNEFIVYYQPKVDCFTEEIVGAEALVRWISPTFGFIGPNVFIPLFERNGFIRKIDLFVFESTCKMLSRRIEAGESVFPISCNFSRLHLLDEEFVEELCAIADKYQVDHSYLEIEITENAAMEDLDLIQEQFVRMKKNHFMIDIDDFGSGYSSLGTLYNIPADVIKLDKSFIDANDASQEGEAILANVAKMIQELGKKLVCEGVETKEQIQVMKKLNCRIIQGYYYSKPIPENELDEFIKKYKKTEEN